MRKRIVLEENDIFKMIAEKYGVSEEEVKVEIINDRDPNLLEVNFVFDENEEVDYSNYIPTENWNGFHGIQNDDEHNEEEYYEDDYNEEDE